MTDRKVTNFPSTSPANIPIFLAPIWPFSGGVPVSGRPIEILLVEDNMADARLVIEAFKDSHVLNTINHVLDGAEAMAYLRRQGSHPQASMPDLVLLDLNLPKKDGREVLEEVRKDPKLHRLPVIALTTSESESDILRCYELGANAYIVKPVDFDKFIAVVQSIGVFWLQIVTLPSHH
ncbi:MAG: response regulator [Alphaproteobacteria bacterium]|nr:response regulator [Alphaproteobacteria bacterium]